MGSKQSIEKEIKIYFKKPKCYSTLVLIDEFNQPFIKINSVYGRYDLSHNTCGQKFK